MEARFPHLRQLELDKVLPIHEQYVKNIVFTLVKKDGNSRYEYKLVLENKEPARMLPEVKILLFDELGVQLGMDEIPKQEPLSTNETRSRNASVDLVLPGEPRYFYVTVGAE